MEKILVELFNLIALAALALIPFLKTRGRGILVLWVITIQVILISLVAFSLFANGPVEYSYEGSYVTGIIREYACIRFNERC